MHSLPLPVAGQVRVMALLSSEDGEEAGSAMSAWTPKYVRSVLDAEAAKRASIPEWAAPCLIVGSEPEDESPSLLPLQPPGQALAKLA